MADDLSDIYAELRDLREQVRILNSANPLQRASVSQGRLRFIGGLLLIDSGGTLTVIGQFNGDGTFTWTGPWTFTGAGDITGDVDISGDVHATGEWTQIGPWHLNGDGDITGEVDITGVLHLLSDLLVDSTGRIKAGVIEIDPSANGGTIGFGDDKAIHAGGSSFGFYAFGHYVRISSAGISLQTSSGQGILITASGTQVVGMPTIPLSSAPAGAFVGAVISDSTGRLSRVVSP